MREFQAGHRQKLCSHEGGCAISVLRGFQAAATPSPEQPGLTPALALLWARRWTGGLLRSLPA